MPASTVYLLRHGDFRQDDVKRFIGQSDQPLNQTGRAQAEFWQRELQTVLFEWVYSSDLSRSIETASIISKELKKTVRVLANLREINLGLWDGLPIDEVRRCYPEEYKYRGANLADHRPLGGESFNDLANRVLPIFEELVCSSTGNLLIVGHAGVNRVILCHLLGRPLAEIFRIRQDYCCLNLIECDNSGMHLRGINLPSLAGVGVQELSVLEGSGVPFDADVHPA